jgi:hypothetical protein
MVVENDDVRGDVRDDVRCDVISGVWAVVVVWFGAVEGDSDCVDFPS